MPTRQTLSPQIPIRKRLSFRLALLFIGTFLALFFIGAVYDVFSQFRERSEAEAALAAQPEPIVIDPKLQADLAKVMAFDTTPSDVAVSDPFIDRSGISSNAPVAVQASLNGKSGSSTTSTSPSGTGTTQTVVGTTGGNNLSPASESTKNRYDAWQKANAYATGTPDPRVFAIEDLVPVGLVSGGRGSDEVMVLSLSLCETFSFPVGTEFYDGYLSSMNRDFVMFSLKGLPRTLTKSFSTAAPCENKQDTQAVNSTEPAKTPSY
jgi:hypothetical protein